MIGRRWLGLVPKPRAHPTPNRGKKTPGHATEKLPVDKQFVLATTQAGRSSRKRQHSDYRPQKTPGDASTKRKRHYSFVVFGKGKF